MKIETRAENAVLYREFFFLNTCKAKKWDITRNEMRNLTAKGDHSVTKKKEIQG